MWCRYTLDDGELVARVDPGGHSKAFLVTAYAQTVAYEDRIRSGDEGPGAWCPADVLESSFRDGLLTSRAPQLLHLRGVRPGENAASIMGLIVEAEQRRWETEE